MRVLLWILDRCEGKVDAVESPIGYLPKEIDTTGLDVSDDVMKELLSVDKKIWLEDVDNAREYFAQFGSRLPKEITEELNKLEANLKK